MTLNADNVRVAVTGGVYFADIGTELPTDAFTQLPEDFIDVGYISEDGVTQTIESSTENIKGWQDGTVVRVIQTEHTYSLAFAMIETTLKNLALYYADPDATADVVKVTGKQSPQQVVVADVMDGKNKIRIVVPIGQITEREDITFKSDEAVTYGVTLATFPDTDGVKAYIYSGETPPETRMKATATVTNRTPAPGEKLKATVKVDNHD